VLDDCGDLAKAGRAIQQYRQHSEDRQ
jgi:hypothetical protein